MLEMDQMDQRVGVSAQDPYRYFNINRPLTDNESQRIQKILANYEDNVAVPESAYFTLIIVYSVVIAVGSCGNLMVLAAVISNKCELSVQHDCEYIDCIEIF